MSWGVPVPNDDMQVMYVWFDALSNYISTLGWPDDEKNFKDFGKMVHQLNTVARIILGFKGLFGKQCL